MVMDIIYVTRPGLYPPAALGSAIGSTTPTNKHARTTQAACASEHALSIDWCIALLLYAYHYSTNVVILRATQCCLTVREGYHAVEEGKHGGAAFVRGQANEGVVRTLGGGGVNILRQLVCEVMQGQRFLEREELEAHRPQGADLGRIRVGRGSGQSEEWWSACNECGE